MPDGGVLVAYRPTWRQAAGRGLFLGLVLALVAVAGLLLRGPRQPGLPGVLVSVAAFAVGVGGSALLGRRLGVDATGAGLRAAGRRGRVSWQRVVDVRTERRGSQSVVMVDLDTGRVWRLPAPYDGPALARDPEFEQKLFTLRNLWETYRTSLPEFPDPAGGTGGDGAAG
jgi:hypothetical protein